MGILLGIALVIKGKSKLLKVKNRKEGLIITAIFLGLLIVTAPPISAEELAQSKAQMEQEKSQMETNAAQNEVEQKARNEDLARQKADTEAKIAKDKAGAESKKAEEEKALADPKVQEELKYQKWVNTQFSVWNGSNDELVKLVKQNLNDPDSFEHEKTQFANNKEHRFLTIKMTYRAKNAFGALILQNVTAMIDYESNEITIISTNS